MKKFLLTTMTIFLSAASAAAQQDQGKTAGDKIRDLVVGKETTAAPKPAENALIGQANEYLRAVLAQDAEKVYKFFSPQYVEMLGGENATIDLIKTEFGIWTEEKLNVVSIKIKPESENQKAGASPQKIKISVKVNAENETETFDGELTAAANGANWSFVNEVTILESFGVKEFADEEESGSETETVEADKESVEKIKDAPVLNGKAVSLPKPVYPKAAAAVNASGTVEVQIVIDEKGNVVSANAISGHPLLQAAAVSAAKQAKFKPTLLKNQPVKVAGTLVYNFTR